MPKIERWENLPEGVRQHPIDRMRERAIGVANQDQGGRAGRGTVA
jgi:hypothetical protein